MKSIIDTKIAGTLEPICLKGKQCTSPLAEKKGMKEGTCRSDLDMEKW